MLPLKLCYQPQSKRYNDHENYLNANVIDTRRVLRDLCEDITLVIRRY